MDDARTSGQPQGKAVDLTPRHAADLTEPGGGPEVRLWIPSGSEVPPVTRSGPPQARTRWLSRWRLLGLAGVLAVLPVGAGTQYWRTINSSVKTDNMQTSVEFMPSSQGVSGTV